ncbi:hypothetical protein ACPV4J_21175 [Photobacterium swingsii]
MPALLTAGIFICSHPPYAQPLTANHKNRYNSTFITLFIKIINQTLLYNLYLRYKTSQFEVKPISDIKDDINE